jgi:hypothetical protein
MAVLEVPRPAQDKENQWTEKFELCRFLHKLCQSRLIFDMHLLLLAQ